MKNIVFSLLTVWVLASCGSSDKSGGGVPGTGLPELTDVQKQQTSRFNNSLQDVSVLTEAQEQQNGTMVSPMEMTPSDSLTKAQQEMVDQMDWAKNNYYCMVSNEGSLLDENSFEKPSVVTLSVTGSDCPISYTSVTKSTPSFSGNTFITAVESTEEFKINPYGIVGFNLDVLSSQTTTKGNVRQTGVNETTYQVNADLKAKITAQSKSAGAVVTDLSMTMNMTQEILLNAFEINVKNLSMTVTATQTYSDFKVVAYVVMNIPQGVLTSTSDPDIEKYSTFYINGKKVSATEFSQVFGNVTNSFL